MCLRGSEAQSHARQDQDSDHQEPQQEPEVWLQEVVFTFSEGVAAGSWEAAVLPGR